MAFNVDGNVTETATTNPAAASKSGNKEKGIKFKTDGATARANLSDDEKALEGSKRDKVTFICALGNPAKSQVRMENGQPVKSHEVVGYKFNISEPMMVPNAPILEGGKGLTDVGPATEIQVPAGEVILNLVETGMFISKLEFAGQFTGGDKPVSLTAKISADRDEPLPVLRLTDPKGSIKTGMEYVAVMQGADEANKVKGTPVVKDEYREKFEVIFKKRKVTTPGGKGKKDKGETTANLAAAFRALYASKAQ